MSFNVFLLSLSHVSSVYFVPVVNNQERLSISFSYVLSIFSSLKFILLVPVFSNAVLIVVRCLFIVSAVFSAASNLSQAFIITL
jgi:hypothetical protein